ncbi:c-Myc-binding protein-like [Macrobrachium nipponense]|uniref:c-Myc-binding protein-like n=1 Tax=Macrobrachium nipponense TaxID=159736 RepID=UPI0030C81919
MERPPSNVALKTMDSEREKFRTYVEKSGVMSALTDVLVRLYEEPNRPTDALTYIKETLGSAEIDAHRLQSLQNKVKEQQSQIESHLTTIQAKETEIASLKARLAQLEKEKEQQPEKVPPEGNAEGPKSA